MKENKDNSSMKNKVKYSQLNKPIQSQYRFKPFIIYLFIILSILALFLINYLMTRKAFNENKIIYLSADRICNKTFEAFNICLEGKAGVDKCVYENRAVEDCYDDTIQLNRVCYIYLSELDLCVNKKKSNNNLIKQCKNELNEVLDCGRMFSILKLDNEKLLSNIMSMSP